MLSPLPPNIPCTLAYIDAGTAVLVIQFLIAGAVASLIFIKGWWRKAVTLLAKLFSKDKEKK